jgi:plastocyanin
VKERDDTAFFSRSPGIRCKIARTSHYATGYHFDNAERLVILSPFSRSFLTSFRRKVINIKVTGDTNTMKKIIVIFVVLSAIIVLTAASCGGSSGSGGTGGSGGTAVHMGETTFLQPSVTISKGSSLNLIDDVPVLHIIGNGSWVNNTAKPAIEPGAPTVNNVQISSAGQSINVGPFNTAGTYHLYCSVHLNMNLTVIVQ